MQKEITTGLDEIAARFQTAGRLIEKSPFGNGHVNDTFLLKYETPDYGCIRYILQRINHSIFTDPPRLMNNIVSITEFLQKKIKANGGDPDRETLSVIKTSDGGSYYKDDNGQFYRMFLYIENTVCRELAESADEFYTCGYAFGNFQRMLEDYPAETLFETIPDFHNTPSRFRDFKKAVDADIMGRASSAVSEIEFALSYEKEVSVLTDLLDKEELPLRVTHNDTKLNNILFDKDSGKALCIIDFDTVMPGLSLYDFGDSIRFGASTGLEDEKDLSKIGIDLKLFEVYTKGFLKGCGGSLKDKEIEMLPMGAKLMTYECGIRFLADYLNGDTYFKTHREGHNLDRAKTQFKLVADMEKHWNEMNSICMEAYRNSQH